MRRADPDGQTFGPDAYVFGNEVGEPVKSIKTAWKLACRRAGITGLHFHDLRRECGSRLLETPGVPLTAVRDWLGHRTIDMTNTYLSTTIAKLQAGCAKVDSARKRAAASQLRRCPAQFAHGLHKRPLRAFRPFLLPRHVVRVSR